MIIARPVQYTSRPDQYDALLDALGLAPLVNEKDWRVWQAGSGRVAIHRVEADDPLDGTAALGFECDDLDGAAAALTALGLRPRFFDASGLRAFTATARDGSDLYLLEPTAESAVAETAGLSVLMLWTTPDVPAATAVLAALGFRGEVASDAGGWVQLRGDGGLAATHDAHNAGAQLSFEFDGDADRLAGRLADREVAAYVVDESYGRTLLMPRPDGGEPIWINERQTDLYGYSRM